VERPYAVCKRCKTQIPQFPELSSEQEARILDLIRADKKVNAMSALQEATGCETSEAKSWVVHHGGTRISAVHHVRFAEPRSQVREPSSV